MREGKYPQLPLHTPSSPLSLSIGIVRPLKQFLSEDLEQLKARKKVYYKILHETHQITDKFGQVTSFKHLKITVSWLLINQCKKHEIQLLNEVRVVRQRLIFCRWTSCFLLLQIGLQLYDSRAELHKATSTYALELNFLHSKKTPDFLNRVVSREKKEKKEKDFTAIFSLSPCKGWFHDVATVVLSPGSRDCERCWTTHIRYLWPHWSELTTFFVAKLYFSLVVVVVEVASAGHIGGHAAKEPGSEPDGGGSSHPLAKSAPSLH